MKKKKYQSGGELDYNAIFQAAYDREQLEKQQKQQKVQSMFNMAGTAATFIPGAQLAAPFMPMLGNMVANAAYQTGGMIKTNGNTDTQLSSTAFQVSGYPTQADGNNYQTNMGNIKLDHNEVVDKSYVFSDILYNPLTGKKFSTEAEKIQSVKGKAEKVLQTAPHDTTVMNTIKHMDNRSKALQEMQETVRAQKGYTNKFQTGGDVTKIGDPNFDYQKYQQMKTINYDQYNLTNKNYTSEPLPGSAESNSYYKLPKAGGASTIPTSIPADIVLPVPAMLDSLSSVRTFQSGGNIQQLGYKDNSPYNSLPYIDINSNNITMEGVSSPVMAYPNNDPATLMLPNKNYSFPNSTAVREIKMQAGGDWITQFQQGYATAFPAANYKPTGKLDKKTQQLLDSEYGKMFIKNNQLYYDRDRKLLNPLAETKSLAAQGLVRTPTNLEKIISPTTSRQVKMDVTSLDKLPLVNTPVSEQISTNGFQFTERRPEPGDKDRIDLSTLTFNRPSREEALARYKALDREESAGTSNSLPWLKNNAGDIAQFVEVGSKFIDVFKKPEVEALRVDPTQITKQSYDPSAALYNSNRNYMNQVNSINTGSVNLDRALKTNAAVNRSNQDSRIIADYERMNNDLNLDYERRLQEKSRYNIQRSDYTNTINSQNRAARDAAMQNAFTSVGNLGEAYNNKKAQADIIEMYKKLFSSK